VLAELETKLKAFIPDYIPAIGEVDAFIKMPRPDGQPETLGLFVLVFFK
jgi:intraflagellar transport protein 46